MATNPYFQVYAHTETQNVVEDIIVETIQMGGFDVSFAKRVDVDVDSIYHEDPMKTFSAASSIEVLLENFQGFDGNGDLFSKFGFEVNDQVTLLMSKKRFGEEFAGQEPEKGDILRFPFNNAIFEVVEVVPDEPFYQLGKNHIYKLICELFEYSHEDVNTGDANIDSILDTLDLTVENGDPDNNDHFGDGDTIEVEADGYLDDTENNPFGKA